MIKQEEDFLSLTDRGTDLANYVMAEFLLDKED